MTHEHAKCETWEQATKWDIAGWRLPKNPESDVVSARGNWRGEIRRSDLIAIIELRTTVGGHELSAPLLGVHKRCYGRATQMPKVRRMSSASGERPCC